MVLAAQLLEVNVPSFSILKMGSLLYPLSLGIAHPTSPTSNKHDKRMANP